jgi:hypothetical protein
MWGALSNEMTDLSFTIACPRQRSNSRVGVPQDSWPYFIVSDSRFPQPGGPGLCTYIPQEQVGYLYPGHWFIFFSRLLRLKKSESELHYDWRFNANQFVLLLSSLRLTTWDFFLQLNPCGHSPYVTSSLTRKWVCLLWICFAFVKCTYRTYSMLLKILPCALHINPLSVQASESRSRLSYVSYATTAA